MVAFGVGRVIAEVVEVEKHRCLAGVLALDSGGAAASCALRAIAVRSIVSGSSRRMTVSTTRLDELEADLPVLVVDREPAGSGRPLPSCRFGSAGGEEYLVAA